MCIRDSDTSDKSSVADSLSSRSTLKDEAIPLQQNFVFTSFMDRKSCNLQKLSFYHSNTKTMRDVHHLNTSRVRNLSTTGFLTERFPESLGPTDVVTDLREITASTHSHAEFRISIPKIIQNNLEYTKKRSDSLTKADADRRTPRYHVRTNSNITLFHNQK
eukprot:TRINITY_DN3032_c0_g8_i2.p1 TRINITY_DN3032_c0_g8~~TRINITY_DN3032_c0_g8_i2.p1  ORF type:complete len:161 (-),score=1.34 TRINITY_DN3032_c0_g8_i2:176-658(-)